jgi:chitodextrinase
MSAALDRAAARARGSIVLLALAGLTLVAAPTALAADRSSRPPEPKGLEVTEVTQTTASIAWQAAPRSAQVVGYALYRDGRLAGLALKTSATFIGLACGTTYVLGVEAVDKHGQHSTRAEIPATTAACPDLTPPSMPTGLAVTAATATSVSIAWTASSDNVGVTGYELDREGTSTGTSTATEATFDGLSCGNSYYFGVVAKDAAGNRSARAELQSSTSPCAANLFVAPDGADYRWTHLAVTYDGAFVRLYVNGAVVATHVAQGELGLSTGPLSIGGNSIWGEWFKGRIDDVRVYNRPLSADELKADMATPVQTMTAAASADAGLVAAYSFDGTTDDESGNGRTASLSGATASPLGKSGGSLYFDGDHDLATVDEASPVPDAASLDLIVGMTLEAWVQPEALGDAWRTVMIKEAGDPVAGTGHLAYGLYANTEDGDPSGHVYVRTNPLSSFSWADTWARGGALPENPCTDAADPCQTFDHAYRMALPGQIVEASAGSYGDQDLRFDPTKTSSDDVVFRPAAGASVTLGSIVLGPTPAVRGASHVTFEGMTLTGDISIVSCGAGDGAQCQPDATAGGDDVTFRNMTVQGPVGFYCASCSHVSFLGGVIGPETYGNPCNGSSHPEVQNVYDSTLPGSRKLRRAHDILIDGTTWQNYSICAAGDHTECLQFEPADNVTIRNAIFRRCDTITVNFADDLAGESLSAAGTPAPDNVLIENSFFDTARSLVGDKTYYALNIRECTNCTVRYNSWTQAPRMPDREISVNNLYLANVGPFNQTACGLPGVTYAFNVWVGAQCDPTDKADVTDAGFVDVANADLHLTRGSPAIGAGDPSRKPARDIDGQLRTGVPDAGADQHG